MSLWRADHRPAARDVLAALADSTRDDVALWRWDLLGSLAHVSVLEDAGLVTIDEAAALRAVLRQLLREAPDLDPALEDVHMNVEHRLTARTPVGAKLHTGRSRNDQVALDLRLFTRAHLLDLADALVTYATTLLDQAEAHAATPLPGRTHLQPAQAVTLGHHLHAHVTRVQRDLARVDAAYRAANVSPLGAGALAGTTLGTNPAVAAKALAMDGTFTNTLDAVSDRDFALDALHAATTTALHLSSLGEEFVLWSTPEFGYVTLPPDLTTGSSLMPQKRNPDGAELMRSLAGTCAGDAAAVASVVAKLPLSYNRDLQDAKAPLLRTLPRVVLGAHVAAALVAGAEWDAARMTAAATSPDLAATDAAEELVQGGTPFRDAYGTVARGEVARPTPDPARRGTPGGPAPKQVLAAVAASRDAVAADAASWAGRRRAIAAAEAALAGGAA